MRALARVMTVVATLALAVGFWLPAPAQTPATPPAHQHTPPPDHTGWTDRQKADRAAELATDARAKADALANPATPCPTTKEQWDKAIKDAACWAALDDLKKDLKEKLPAQFGRNVTDAAGTTLGTALTGKKGVTQALQTKLQGCNTAASGFSDGLAVYAEVLRRAQEERTAKLVEIGLEKPTVQCISPNCPAAPKK